MDALHSDKLNQSQIIDQLKTYKEMKELIDKQIQDLNELLAQVREKEQLLILNSN